MKIRIALSLLAFVTYLIVHKAFSLLYSPLSGAATASQLNDATASYAVARLFRDGSLYSFLFWGLILTLALIWLVPLLAGSRKSQPKNDQQPCCSISIRKLPNQMPPPSRTRAANRQV